MLRALGAALLLACAAAHAWADCTAAQLLAGAQRTITGPEGTATSQVLLPDRLGSHLHDERVQIRYDIDVSTCAQAPAAGLWLFRVGASYRITSQGRPLELLSARAMLRPELLVGGLLAARPHTYNGRIPALFALPAGARTVTVELQSPPYIPSGIVRARLGPATLLLPGQAAALEGVVAYADAASAVVLVLGAMAFLLWLQRRRDLGLLWLSLACGLWGLRGLAFFSHSVYLTPLIFEQFNLVYVLLTSGALAASVACLLEVMTPRRGRGLLAVVAAGLLLLLVTVVIGRGAALARALMMASAFGLVCWCAWPVWLKRAELARWQIITLSASLFALVACSVHDLMVVFGALPPDHSSYVFWGFITLLVGFAAMSGQYVVLTLNRAERSNEELEQHVARKTTELEHSYTLLRESERDTARAQERERLLRDMHDGLGAQLMTALRGVERGALAPQQIAQSLQDSLDELRLLMDSTDMGHYLPGALAAWRNRWDARLAAAGVTLDWRIDESLDQVQLSSEESLQVMRILQEAATNVVKHSQAARMSLDARVLPGEGKGTLHIEIEDDGVGLGADTKRAGARGLKNMHYRAGQIGGELSVASREPSGCRVRLTLSLRA